jgi:hypothetical protein
MLSGYLQSGKDTVGSILCQNFEFSRLAFADVLKDEVSKIYGISRESMDTAEGKSRLINGTSKTVRDMIIYHGEKQRKCNVNYWVDKVVDQIHIHANQHDKKQRIVITDWRFPNEYFRISEKLCNLNSNIKIYTWRIDRWNKPPLIDPTEIALDSFEFDMNFTNHKCMNSLESNVKYEIYKLNGKGITLPLLLTDVDDVLLQWLNGFKKFILNSNKYSIVSDSPNEWDIQKWIFDLHGKMLDTEIILNLISDFNHSEAFANLLPYEDAIEPLKIIKSNGYHVVAISSCTDNAHAVERRKKNLFQHFQNLIDYVICLPLGTNKKEILSRFEYSCVFIDDNPNNVMEGEDVGHLSILMNRPWNLEYSQKYQNVSNWNELLSYLEF